MLLALPAENAARERKTHPAKWTYDNIANMRRQLQRMGLSIDWELEVASCHSGYYHTATADFLVLLEGGACRPPRLVGQLGSCR